MSNAFYAPGEQRATRVNDLFATVARRYDLLNDLMSFGLHRVWKRCGAEIAAVKSGARALDVCCGTGDISFALAQRGAEVVGLDFSEKMLAVAKNRSQKSEVRSQKKKSASNLRPLTSVFRPPTFIQGDAQQIPFPDNSFDVVTIGYGLRNLASWEIGLTEMRRVTKPGGRIVVLEFGKPPSALWRALYFAHLRCSVPLIGLLFCGNAQAYAYILESLKHYPGQLAVAEKMRELKFTNVRCINLLGGAMAINYGEKPV